MGFMPLLLFGVVMKCSCQEWKDNIDKVNAGFTMTFIHGGQGYEGAPFKYCPWCGKELTE